MILAEAGLEPSFLVGGDVHDVGTGAHWAGGRWLVVEADESDGTFLELPLAGTIVTNVEADHLDHYGTLRRRRRRASTATWPGRRAQGRCAPTTRSRPAWPRRHDAVTYGTDADARYQAGDIDDGRGSRCASSCDRDGAELGRGARCRCGACTTSATPLGAIAMADAVGVPFDGRGARRWPASAASPAASTCGVAHEGITLVDDYAHLPTRDRRRARRRGRRAATAGRASSPCSSPTATAAWPCCRRSTRDAFVDADVAVITDIYPSGEAPLPGVTGKLVVDAVLDAHPEQRVVWLPERADLVAFLVGRAPPGRRLPLDGLRRRRRAARRGAGRPRQQRRSGAMTRRRRRRGRRHRPSPPSVLGPLAERDVPLGPLTTYRVGGAAAAPGAGGRRRADLGPSAVRRGRVRAARARGRAGLEPARRRPRLRRAGRRARAPSRTTIERRRRRTVTAGRRGEPAGAGPPDGRPPGSPGSSGRSACPGRWAAPCA